MSAGELLTEFEFAAGAQRGARLSLYSDRMALHGADAMEVVPLTHLASVRVAFERDLHKVYWAAGLLAAALVLASISGPLRKWLVDQVAKLGSGGGRESLDSVLIAAFTALGNLAGLLTPLAVVLTGIAAILLLLFWIGQTTLTLSFAATERAYPVRGRNRLLFQFADAVADQLAARRGRSEP